MGGAETYQPGDRITDDPTAVFGPREVAFDGDRAPPGGADFGSGALRLVARAAVVNGDVGAGRGEPERDRPPDADASAGDESELSIERCGH